jgi:nicotinate phosphoribosyltransferase
MDAQRLVSENSALLTDLYELTMVQAYWRERLLEEAVFSLFVRRLPPTRNFLVACGLEDALQYLESLRFTPAALEYLAARPEFQPDFVAWLADFRFRGQVRAVPEGTVIFANEPILEVSASLPEAQLAESLLLNQLHLQTTLASKAARVVLAAGGRDVVDFGLRRMHGTDAALKAARAFHIAGLAGTSNVLAGFGYGIPLAGTMAHSYIQVHESELEAFREFSELYPETILLVDTYDSIEGVHHVVRLASELGHDFRVRAIRLDSGDLEELAVAARGILDDAGLTGVQIVASSGLDEQQIAALIEAGAPIDAFGVGTSLGVSSDAPALDMVYKLTEYAGRGRLKLSPGKSVLPGRKQIFRRVEGESFDGDLIARDGERCPGQPLLELVMENGRRLTRPAALSELRAHAARQIAALPQRLRQLAPADPPYPIEISGQLRSAHHRLTDAVRRVEYA